MTEHSMIFRNIDGTDHPIKYKIFSSQKKRGREMIGSHDVVFYTNDDEALRHINDIAELVVEKNKLSYTNTRFFEVQNEVMELIEMSWDQKRYRGTNRIEESFLKKESDLLEWKLLKEKYL